MKVGRTGVWGTYNPKRPRQNHRDISEGYKPQDDAFESAQKDMIIALEPPRARATTLMDLRIKVGIVHDGQFPPLSKTLMYIPYSPSLFLARV